MGDLTIEVKRDGNKDIVIAKNGQAVHTDRISSIIKADDRKKFADALLQKAPGLDRTEVDQLLLEEANRRVTAAPTMESPLPEIILPGGGTPILPAAGDLGKLLDRHGGFYTRGQAIVTIAQDENSSEDQRGKPILRPVTNATLASSFETVATLQKYTKDGNLIAATCNESTAKLLASATTFIDALPKIRLLSTCPVLTVQDGKLIEVTGYDRKSGILAYGSPTKNVSLDEAKNLFELVLKDFNFATPSDKSRAIAGILSPALVQGLIFGARAPIDLSEADKSQTGKGYRNKLTAAFYNASVHTITQKDRGVGSLEESFDAKLVKGYSFIAIDNVRGKMNSPAIESFATEDIYPARVPYMAPIDIETARTSILFTSNKADITPDFANRTSCVRIVKQPNGYTFATYPTGQILDHVRANQPTFLGAVFAVIRAWYDAGKPQTNDTRHDYRVWARSLDWIVQNLLGQAPLLDGHQETQIRMTTPALNWLRSVALAVKAAGLLDTSLQANNLLNIIDQSPDVEMPGYTEGADLNDEKIWHSAVAAIGRKLGQCFAKSPKDSAGRETVQTDNLFITRVLSKSTETYREIKTYTFSEKPAPPDVNPLQGNQGKPTEARFFGVNE